MKKTVYCSLAIFLGRGHFRPENEQSGMGRCRPGYQMTFPRDHYPHDQFRTEWWYFTGNLKPRMAGHLVIR